MNSKMPGPMRDAENLVSLRQCWSSRRGPEVFKNWSKMSHRLSSEVRPCLTQSRPSVKPGTKRIPKFEPWTLRCQSLSQILTLMGMLEP